MVISIDAEKAINKNQNILSWLKKSNKLGIERKFLIDKQEVVYTYIGILFSLKKEWYSDSNNMDEPWKHYIKCSKLHTKGKTCDSSYMKYLE